MSLFGIPVWPEQASTFAADVDALYSFILATTAFFTLLVSVVVVYLGLRYRRRHPGEVGERIEGSLPLELTWSIIPMVLAMIFSWLSLSASCYESSINFSLNYSKREIDLKLLVKLIDFLASLLSDSSCLFLPMPWDALHRNSKNCSLKLI